MTLEKTVKHLSELSANNFVMWKPNGVDTNAEDIERKGTRQIP